MIKQNLISVKIFLMSPLGTLDLLCKRKKSAGCAGALYEYLRNIS